MNDLLSYPVLFWTVVGGVIGAIINTSKGHNGIVGFLGGAVLGPILVWLFLAQSDDKEGLGLRHCSSCAEWIPIEAMVCKHCRREFVKKTKPSNQVSNNLKIKETQTEIKNWNYCAVCEAFFQHSHCPACNSGCWYLARGKQKLGPYTLPQLIEFAKQGRVLPNDMLLQDGAQKWILASSVKEIKWEGNEQRQRPSNKSSESIWKKPISFRIRWALLPISILGLLSCLANYSGVRFGDVIPQNDAIQPANVLGIKGLRIEVTKEVTDAGITLKDWKQDMLGIRGRITTTVPVRKGRISYVIYGRNNVKSREVPLMYALLPGQGGSVTEGACFTLDPGETAECIILIGDLYPGQNWSNEVERIVICFDSRPQWWRE